MIRLHPIGDDVGKVEFYPVPTIPEKFSFNFHRLELIGVFLFRAEKISARNWNQITKFQFRAEKKII